MENKSFNSIVISKPTTLESFPLHPFQKSMFFMFTSPFFLLINLTLFYLIIILTNISHNKSVIIKRFPDI